MQAAQILCSRSRSGKAVDRVVEADDGTRLHVEDSGSGRAVILVAGLGGVGSFWNPTVE